jgi:hypothetical protein
MAKKQKSLYTPLTEWEKKFKPIKNHLDPDARYDGCMFEMPNYHSEEFVTKQDMHRIWTVVTDDHGNECIIAGWHVVNREGFLVTTKKWKDNEDWNVYDEDIIELYERMKARENGYQMETVVPQITKGLKRHVYGDHRDKGLGAVFTLAFDQDSMSYILLEQGGDGGGLWHSLQEFYDTPQQAVDHAWSAFGATMVNTEIIVWDGE